MHVGGEVCVMHSGGQMMLEGPRAGCLWEETVLQASSESEAPPSGLCAMYCKATAAFPPHSRGAWGVMAQAARSHVGPWGERSRGAAL